MCESRWTMADGKGRYGPDSLAIWSTGSIMTSVAILAAFVVVVVVAFAVAALAVLVSWDLSEIFLWAAQRILYGTGELDVCMRSQEFKVLYPKDYRLISVINSYNLSNRIFELDMMTGCRLLQMQFQLQHVRWFDYSVHVLTGIRNLLWRRSRRSLNLCLKYRSASLVRNCVLLLFLPSILLYRIHGHVSGC